MNNTIDFKFQYTKGYEYFLFDLEEGERYYFRTEKDMLAHTKQVIAEYLTGEGWDTESVEGLVAGKVTHISHQTNIRKRPPDDELDEDGLDVEEVYWADWDEMCGYELTSIS